MEASFRIYLSIDFRGKATTALGCFHPLPSNNFKRYANRYREWPRIDDNAVVVG